MGLHLYFFIGIVITIVCRDVLFCIGLNPILEKDKLNEKYTIQRVGTFLNFALPFTGLNNINECNKTPVIYRPGATKASNAGFPEKSNDHKFIKN